ncbi:PemK family transcriptional regulator [Paenibacillus sp. HJL G12]|uniref:PemK family transcriptional regulator n=1 Tax=Paenibacillus dendrobii TaxID=2691084 RepID=A0A7X3IJ50_9BACL|nr:type II toxin-antitoxin system PemK/MazF family toxin [Paenibacillus dendrobii]MWV44904.1 PemK family transcriptional regulator [Paenibacillus dendrobii]
MAVAMNNTVHNEEVKQFEIWLADLGEIPEKSSVQGGVRPVLIISNDKNNRYSPLVMVSPITSSSTKARIPTHVTVNASDAGFKKDSVILFEQHFTIDKKSKLMYKLFEMPHKYENQLLRALEISTTRMFSR